MKRSIILIFLLMIGCTSAETNPETNPETAPVDSAYAPLVQGGDGQAAAYPGTLGEATPRAANADVVFVSAEMEAGNIWTFRVTVDHPDLGWDDYADGWDIVSADGSVLLPDPESPFTRLLLHPHETERPFTRSQSGIVIPDGVSSVIVRAHDLVDGFGGKVVVVDLTAETGPDFEVNRAQ